MSADVVGASGGLGPLKPGNVCTTRTGEEVCAASNKVRMIPRIFLLLSEGDPVRILLDGCCAQNFHGLGVDGQDVVVGIAGDVHGLSVAGHGYTPRTLPNRYRDGFVVLG